MLHRSVNDNGQERMEMVDSVPVPAHGEVKFEPGGYHLMCMSPTAEAARGRSVPVTLSFQGRRFAHGELSGARRDRRLSVGLR